MTNELIDFAEFFRLATGREPYAYQIALGEMAQPPSVLRAPTGTGKTQALIVSWLYSRRVRKTGPRRLVYTLPMRTLVEQTREVAGRIRERLQLEDDALPIHTLMGGLDMEELRAWQQWPERDQILIGTTDMLISRALNRGYAASRFSWPIAFGLLNNDCHWVFDEVQLMGPARATSAQLDGLRARLGTVLPCRTTWASATVEEETLTTVDRSELGEVLAIPEEDRSGALRKRLNARKTLTRVDLGDGAAAPNPATVIAKATVEHHVQGTRTLLVLNTVELAQATYRELRRLGAPTTILLHSRFRPGEREGHMRSALANPNEDGTIVVSTQVVEAGVDMSARTLITETAPFSSVVQRLGRCNREGEYEDATVLWLDRGPLKQGLAGQKAAAPYLPGDIEKTRNVLMTLEGASLSPAELERIVEHNQLKESDDDPTVLRMQDLLDLFDTSPDLSGMDIDIAPFIRVDDERNVTVFFRELASVASTNLLDQPAPEHHELVQISRFGIGARDCWVADQIDGGWARRASRDIPAGATVMLRSSEGGYDPEIGWDGKTKHAVQPIPLIGLAESLSGIDSDPETVTRVREELLPHLEKVAEEVTELACVLGLEEWREILRCAGALHDLGKAHPVFQATLRTVMFGDDHTQDDRLWAKSDKYGGRYRRPYFRHELASALAIGQLDGIAQMPRRELIAYLIASHHGKVRLSIRPAPEERRPGGVDANARFALGVADGDVLPEAQTPIGNTPPLTLDLSSMELGADNSWTDAAVRMRDDITLGPFRIGFLEALLRTSDWRASGA